MTDEARKREQIQRALDESEVPADAPAEQPLAPDIPPDRTRGLRYTGLARMRLQFKPEDVPRIQEIHDLADRQVKRHFAVAFDLMDRVYLCVRIPLTENGEVVPGPDGRPQWERHPNGSPVEHWYLLTDDQREQFLFEITTHLFEWEQAAADMWAEAMYAKVQWEQAFADGYLAPTGRMTIDDRTQAGHSSSEEYRFFAVFQSSLSRKADAVVRSMQRVANVLEKTRR